MKKKTFFTTQFMFLLFFNGAVLLLSVMLWKEKLEIQKEMALSEHYMILSSVMRDMQAEGGDGYDAAKLMEPYTRYRKDKRRALFLYRGSSCYIPMWMIGRFLTWKNSGSRRGNAQDPDRRAVSLCGGEIPAAVG